MHIILLILTPILIVASTVAGYLGTNINVQVPVVVDMDTLRLRTNIYSDEQKTHVIESHEVLIDKGEVNRQTGFAITSIEPSLSTRVAKLLGQKRYVDVCVEGMGEGDSQQLPICEKDTVISEEQTAQPGTCAALDPGFIPTLTANSAAIITADSACAQDETYFTEVGARFDSDSDDQNNLMEASADSNEAGGGTGHISDQSGVSTGQPLYAETILWGSIEGSLSSQTDLYSALTDLREIVDSKIGMSSTMDRNRLVRSDGSYTSVIPPCVPGQKLHWSTTINDFECITANIAENGLTLNSNVFRLGGQILSDTRLFDTALHELIYLDTDTGNVGIGTTNPGYRLHVAGASSTLVNLGDQLFVDSSLLNQGVGIGGAPDTGLHLRKSSGWNQFYITNDSSSNTQNQLWFATGYGGGDENWAGIGQFSDDGALRLTGGDDLSNPTMVLTDSDKVGIGTSAPANQLSVNGNADFIGSVGVGATSPDRLLHAETADTSTNTVSYGLRIGHVTSNTSTTGFGSGLEFELENSSGTNVIANAFDTMWTDATSGSEDSRIDFKTMTNGSLGTNLSLVGGSALLRAASTANGDRAYVVETSGGDDIAWLSGYSSFTFGGDESGLASHLLLRSRGIDGTTAGAHARTQIEANSTTGYAHVLLSPTNNAGDLDVDFYVDATGAAHSNFDGLTLGNVGGVTLADGGVIGLGAGKGLIQFDDESTDTISIMNSNVGIGTTNPMGNWF